MNLFLPLVLVFSTLVFAQEETDFDQFVDEQKKENLSRETLKKNEVPSDQTSPKEGETKFDQILEKKKKKYFKDGDLKPRKQQGLIDPLIDATIEASQEGKKN